MAKFTHTLNPIKLASIAVILTLITGSVYYWYKAHHNDQLSIDSIKAAEEGRQTSESLLRITKQFKEARDKEGALPVTVDPLSAEDQQSMTDETEQIKAWHKLSKEQQILEEQKLVQKK